jgi:transcription-repair coupling factor (superfamily II helicase)
MFDCTSNSFKSFERSLKSGKNFTATGLTALMRLVLISKTPRPALVVVANEQTALRYQNDLFKMFSLDAQILPYQQVSMYEEIAPNRYDYFEQVRILHSKPDIVIAPVKVCLEKFPNAVFFEKNTLHFKIGDTLDLRELAQKLVNLGYTRVTMVSDVG